MKYRVITWLILGTVGSFVFYDSRRVKHLFGLHFLSSLPVRDYDESDYDYKFWELALAKEHDKFGNILNTD
jgi:hypothetical protein